MSVNSRCPMIPSGRKNMGAAFGEKEEDKLAAFAREFLKAKGVHHVDAVFDTFDPSVPHAIAAD